MTSKINTLLILLLIVVGSNTIITWNFLTVNISLIFISGIILLEFFLNYKYHNLKWSYITVLVFIVLLLNIYVTMVFNGDFQNGNILLVIKIFLGLALANSMPFIDFREAYTRAMYFLSLFSLLCTYVLKYLPLVRYVPTFFNVAGVRFYNFGLCSVITINDYYRNFGVFSEPGMFVCFLVVAMSFAIIDDQAFTKKKMIRIIIFAITLATTFSPVGIFCAGYLLAIYLLFHPNLKKKEKVIALLLMVVFVVLLFSIPEFEKSFQDSIDKFTEKQSSYVGRSYVLMHNLRAWMKSPLYGLGLYNMIYVFEIDDLRNIASSNTSTTTLYLATYGIVFTILHVMGIFKAFNIGKVGKICVLAFFFSINSQALFHSEIIWYLTMYGFFQERRNNSENLFNIRNAKKFNT